MTTTSGDIEKLFESRGALIEKEISLLSVKIEPPELAEIVRYALSQHGKKVRASLLTIACEAVGGSVTKALIPAVMVEMIHNTSLILDDVIDASEMRRGRKTINSRWGNDMALLACDAMIALAIRQAMKADMEMSVAIIECASDSLLNLAEGEAMELIHKDFTTADYYRIADNKTASLFRASAEVGALVGGGSKKEIAALRDYGRNIGIAFQIRDDVLDFRQDGNVTGKPELIDLKMNRPTIVLLLAQENGVAREKMLSLGREELLRELAPHLDRAEEIAREYVETAKNCLKPLKDSRSKDMLIALADFVIARNK
ncbi:MAG: Short chain isoprenyl diphosphate synthase [Methanocella sp. PtaU1.Bin125]|nr:MAG: Short chain isoprenyl diphosphate synthase [Methanocella sp. PtaU1.Bin125]